MASLALQFHADKIYYGAHEDTTGVIYADCSREFIDAAKELIRIGTGGRVELVTPFAGQTKAKVIETGLRLQVPYELTYSCYSGTVPPCGHCGTCIDRKQGLFTDRAFDRRGDACGNCREYCRGNDPRARHRTIKSFAVYRRKRLDQHQKAGKGFRDAGGFLFLCFRVGLIQNHTARILSQKITVALQKKCRQIPG